MTRVLVVDDEQNIRQVLVYVLEDEGYQVVEAQDGETALRLIERQHPDVIILDMKMPGMDGWEFADAAQRGADVRADSYVPKPFDLDVLLECVSAIVGTAPGA